LKEVFDDGRKWKHSPPPANYRKFLRWHRYPYSIASSYPDLRQLPEWSEIPTVLNWVNSGGTHAGVGVAYSQLLAMSRANFGQAGRPLSVLSAKALAYHNAGCSNRWENWWQAVGKPYPERLKTRGRTNSEAWKIVSRDNPEPVPDYPVAIPEAWTIRAFYRAGDYDGVQTEALTLRRSSTNATLIRSRRRSTRGPISWEEWQTITVKEADDFGFAIAYAIDNPWLLKAPKQDADNRKRTKVEGRDISLYYGSFRYMFSDGSDNVWWNDDPTRWYGADEVEGGFLNAPGNLGPVCLLLWRTFPDSPGTPGPARNRPAWRAVRMPDAVILRQLTDDLEIRGEIMDYLWNSERTTDALESLAKFGLPDQVSAINRLQTELSLRLRNVDPLFSEDPNQELLRARAEELLAAAQNAKAAIEERQIK
jgi:hypothetical protein